MEMTMENLPYEIVDQILIDPQLSIKDILNVGETCTRLHNFQKNNDYFWKKKYQANWPQFMKMFSPDFANWLEEIRHIYKLRNTTHALLEVMPAKYKETSLDFVFINEWQPLLEESSRTYHYMVLDLMSIIHNTAEIRSIEAVPVDTPGNCTLKYYATKALIFIRQSYLRKIWKNFIEGGEEQQTSEDAAIIIAQWFQPTIDVDATAIKQELDSLANQVLKWLLVINPKHPLHKIAPETFRQWNDRNLKSNRWSTAESADIIRCLVEVLHDSLHLQESYNMDLEKNYFINEILRHKEGIPLLVGVVYASVARRLGLKCILIDFTNYCLLQVSEFKNQPSAEYCYIDIFKGGNIIRKGICPYRLSDLFEIPRDHLTPQDAKAVVETIACRLHAHYEQSRHSFEMTQLRLSKDFLQLIAPSSQFAMLTLRSVYGIHALHQTAAEYSGPQQIQENQPIDLCCATEVCKVQVEKLTDDSSTQDTLRDLYTKFQLNPKLCKNLPKQRPKDLQFAVGMVMTHVRMGYTCVIYDWDPTCVEGPLQMESGVYKLKRKEQQPFYKVLADGDLHYYVAEEDLTPAPKPRMLTSNADIGRYFSHFFQTHYVPNLVLEELFPEDRAVRHYFHDYVSKGC